METFAAIVLAAFKAFPVLETWYQRFTAWYFTTQVARMRAENLEAVRTALATHNTIPVEEALGNPEAGGLSGLPGVQIKSKIPGVTD